MKKPHRLTPACFSTPATFAESPVLRSSSHHRLTNLPSSPLSPGEKLSEALMSLCQEIAVTLLRRTSSGEKAAVVRHEIESGLRQHLSCPDRQIKAIVELSIELIYVKSYGRYRRNALELAYLLDLCSGQVGDPVTN
jgi:hypothetical protein